MIPAEKTNGSEGRESRSQGPRGNWTFSVESYPAEVLLRIRQGMHTVLLVGLSGVEVQLARASSDGLRQVAVARLMAAGVPVEGL